jgi:hypothetical protein
MPQVGATEEDEEKGEDINRKPPSAYYIPISTSK